MRDFIAAGNWKMNMTIASGKDLAKGLIDSNTTSSDKVILCVPFTHLAVVNETLQGQDLIHLAAQNLCSEPSGAFTGEISAAMLVDAGAKYVLVGHSERRGHYHEDAEILSKKINLALEHGLKVIYCLGEPLEVREADGQNAHIKAQLESDLFLLDSDQMANITIAYEPIWAIGTGKTASPEQAQDMHAFIRATLESKYGAEIAQNTSILYGGSVKPANATEIFAKKDVDGGLVGGASLKVDSFAAICNSFPAK